jgi:hypothetical protein
MNWLFYMVKSRDVCKWSLKAFNLFRIESMAADGATESRDQNCPRETPFAITTETMGSAASSESDLRRT